MAAGAKETNIPDPPAASRSLAAMRATAEDTRDALQRAAQRITEHEAGEPWGRAPEYGGKFAAVYRAGNGGADFVKSQAHVLADQAVQGLTLANEAVRASLDVDQDGAKLFKVAGSDDVARTVKGINDARAATEKSQEQDGG